jgi:MFS family permease
MFWSEMPARVNSSRAIWLASIGIGFLFLARGAFQPYAFPLFENLGRLRYAQIALIINCYVLAQSICAPLAGWYTDHTSVRIALATSIAFGGASFLLVSINPGFLMSAIAIFVAGLAFVLCKISLNTILVVHSSPDILRRSVAKRATLLNMGSFIGNSIAVRVTARFGYSTHAVLLGLLHLPLAIGLAVPRAQKPAKLVLSSQTPGFKALCKNRGFVADGLRRLAMVLPYGCWGTIIPKYVIDQYHSNEKVWTVYLTSLCTTVIGAHFLAVYLSDKLYRRGFRWEWWSMVSVVLYCTGLLLLFFARHPMMLPIAVVIFICGEVVMTPCFDETAKRHSHDAGMGKCLGLLHLVDGLGRMFGSVFALGVYGVMRNSYHRNLYWPIVVLSFFTCSSLLHIVAHYVGQHDLRPRIIDDNQACVPMDRSERVLALVDTQDQAPA